MELAGRVALVTGSTSGIGLGIAEALADAGAGVMLHGFGTQAAIGALREMFGAKARPPHFYSAADLADPQAAASLVAETVAQLGRLDIVVNNAGIQHVDPIERFPAERWDAVLAVNLSAAFHVTKAAIAHLRAGGRGRIINIASAHGLVGSAGKAAYVAAKHGLLGLTKVTAIELAGQGITCNAICPGWVLTPLVQAQLDARAAAEGLEQATVRHRLLAEKQPLAEFTTPAQIGALARFLCSDAAATITGTPISIDGGWTAQ